MNEWLHRRMRDPIVTANVFVNYRPNCRSP